ncbi:MAG TPA: 3-oxoacyl-[acyl-carrier-protein] synthase III C-terminal domain-containing protein [Gemmatimonadaceae bacterium]|nr:3-oxoacyl-[acyl-carrier-protein] synthase III C-terminal domain-containing protein [Gemmatimonadaceae bacterium]
MNVRPGISAISYAVPAESRSVRELAAAGSLESDAVLLERFGFERVGVAVEETPYDLALAAASDLLRDHHIDPSSIDALLYAGAPGALAFAKPRDALTAARALCDTRRFEFAATRLQFDLSLDNATVLGLDQLACTAILGAVRMARALCIAEGLERVLCVSSEFYPAAAGREAITNGTSDAACAVLVERNANRNRVVGGVSVTKGFYWSGDRASMRDEIMASYFPTAARVMHRTIASAGWDKAAVNWIMPHNVSATSWDILLRLAGLPNARLWNRNIARIGHTLSGDNFINLRDALDGGAVRAGDKVLVFSYGYGAHWTGLALEA